MSHSSSTEKLITCIEKLSESIEKLTAAVKTLEDKNHRSSYSMLTPLNKKILLPPIEVSTASGMSSKMRLKSPRSPLIDSDELRKKEYYAAPTADRTPSAETQLALEKICSSSVKSIELNFEPF